MYKNSKHKRKRIHIRRFFELIILPLVISALILLFIFWIMIDVIRFQFTSVEQMRVILIGGGIVIASGVFEISRMIIKRLLKK